MNKEDRRSNVPRPAPLVEVRRGPIVESRHRGHVVASDGDGRVLARLGEPETVTYLRSSSKPHQAVPLVASGAAERFGFTPREIAVACGSHSGQDVHAETVAGMLRKIGLDESALRCGVHEPFDQQTALALRERGERPSILRNNCSGKHTGMLALALQLARPPKLTTIPKTPSSALSYAPSRSSPPSQPKKLSSVRTAAESPSSECPCTRWHSCMHVSSRHPRISTSRHGKPADESWPR